MQKKQIQALKKELRKEALIKCPHCFKNSHSNEIELVEKEHPSHPHLIARYFNCPYCGHITTVGIDDEEQLQRIKVYQDKTETFRKLVQHKANSSLLRSKQNELRELNKQLSSRRAELMEKYPL